AYFALMMKARQYNRRILSKPTRHNLHVFESTVDVPNEVFEKMKASKDTIDDLRTLVSTFKKAKLLGSIMNFEKKFDFDALFSAVNSLPDSTQLDLFGLQAAKNSLLGILKITQVLQTHFDVVATNPPYLNRMNGDLKKYVKKYYKAYSGDLFSVFIWKNIEMTKQDGYSAYMTPFVWMFIKTYEGLRKSILDSKQISSLIQMEYSAFEEATVPINTFVLKNDMSADSTGTYLKLSDFKGGMEVQKRYVLKAIADPSVSYLYRTKQTNFEKIPGSPIVYQNTDRVIAIFQNTALGHYACPRLGMATADNSKFLRMWFEISINNIGFNMSNRKEAKDSHLRWFPYEKGGDYCKWYGNHLLVVDWQDDGIRIRNFTDSSGKIRSHNYNLEYIFKKGITWNALTSGNFSARLSEPGFLFDNAGSKMFFNEEEHITYFLALLSTPVVHYVLSVMNPTLNFQPGSLANLPIILINKPLIKKLSEENISLTRQYWNQFEYSWDFVFPFKFQNIAEHQKSPTTKLLIFFDFCDKYVPIQFRGLIFYGKLSKKR
ncbi:MAG: Eco57I restriction-modification methylase domain-containing protein, partial [Streptococcus sp.]|nr:Eco57I restriction-modification methylase domain-containing protein [Streptococcus sp.]